MTKLLGIFLILSGLILFAFFGVVQYQRNLPSRLYFNGYHPEKIESLSQKAIPKEVVIGSVGIDLPVYPAKIDGTVWQDTKKGISFLSSSAFPGEIGNSIFYGHNFPNLLGNLTKVKIGDSVTIKLANDTKKQFQVISTKIVSPNDTSVLKNSNTPVLTIYTCTGFLDSLRFVVSATPTT